jgi:hypothetical protein
LALNLCACNARKQDWFRVTSRDQHGDSTPEARFQIFAVVTPFVAPGKWRPRPRATACADDECSGGSFAKADTEKLNSQIKGMARIGTRLLHTKQYVKMMVDTTSHCRIQPHPNDAGYTGWAFSPNPVGVDFRALPIRGSAIWAMGPEVLP